MRLPYLLVVLGMTVGWLSDTIHTHITTIGINCFGVRLCSYDGNNMCGCDESMETREKSYSSRGSSSTEDETLQESRAVRGGDEQEPSQHCKT